MQTTNISRYIHTYIHTYIHVQGNVWAVENHADNEHILVQSDDNSKEVVIKGCRYACVCLCACVCAYNIDVCAYSIDVCMYNTRTILCGVHACR